MMAANNEKRIIHTIEDNESKANVIIPEDAFETIATLAALEVKGVASVDGTITKEKVQKISTKNISSWVKVEVDEEKNSVKVYISIELENGYTIPKTCKAIQEKVKNTITNMTGFGVHAVNIKICGVKTA